MEVEPVVKSLTPTSKADAVVMFASALVILGAIFTIWEVVEPIPLYDGKVLSVIPDDGVLDRTKGQAAIIRRDQCSTRTTEVTVTRHWIDESGGITPMIEDTYQIKKGCHPLGPFRVYPPGALGEGKHTYRVTLRWCNHMKCLPYRIRDVEFIVKGWPPLNHHINRDDNTVPGPR
jgi:hypothetical protein